MDMNDDIDTCVCGNNVYYHDKIHYRITTTGLCKECHDEYLKEGSEPPRKKRLILECGYPLHWRSCNCPVYLLQIN